MSGRNGRTRAIAERRYPFARGAWPGDERSAAQLSRADGPLRVPGAPTPAENHRARMADEPLRIALGRRTLPWW